jgi:hypothetical protein
VTGEPGEALSQRRLNRSLLARQLLLERSTLPIPAVLDQLVGIQNQYAPNAYIRLWSCVEGFQRDDLTRAYEQGSVVQGTLMRGTIHTVSPGDYHPMVAAVRASRRDWAEKIHRQSAADRDELIARVRSAVGGRTLTRAELVELRAGASDAAWQTIDTDAELLRVPPSGTWERRRADVFGLADDVIGRHDELPEADGLAPVARRYLAGFGPASVGDVASFIGMPVTPLKPILASLELRRYRDEAGRELLDVADGPLPRRRHAGAGPLPAHLGRDVARPRAADADPPGSLSAAHLPHEDAALIPNVPGRRPGRRHVAFRGRARRPRPVRNRRPR